ncbi:CHAT domain-containing protein [Kutzneria sp. CA-103260]|uniref:CHAT domain-containing protein n=1 Tax=Kutzneria sp. CA-103260 TaxID=2802641 RepID=UPI001BACC546|nr:CHAT domain-containing protein [Kutzneria sp. CA-103260]QUQ63682.1 CHAT domain protein [Kutzneria sp. CA-103260]
MTSTDDAKRLFEAGKRFLLEHGDNARAAEAFEASLRLEPFQPHGQFLLGVSRFQDGDYAGALLPLAQCLELTPDHREGRNALGMALQQLGWADDGFVHLARAAHMGNPQAPDTLAAAGKDFCRQCARPFDRGGECRHQPARRTSPRPRVWPFSHLPAEDWRSRVSLPSEALSELGAYYLGWHRQGTEDALDLALPYLEIAAAATSSDGLHTEYPKRLSELAVAYRERFAHLGQSDDLDHAIDCGEWAYATAEAGIPERALICSNLGLAYMQRHDHAGAAADLDRAIVMLDEALTVTDVPAEDRAAVLANAGNLHLRDFKRGKSRTSLDRAVDLMRQAVDATPADHWRLAVRLNNLGSGFQERFELTADLQDLDEAVLFLQRAVDATPAGARGLPHRLANLGFTLVTRFLKRRHRVDLDQGIAVLERAAAITPDDRPELCIVLSRLSQAYRARWEEDGGGVDRETVRMLARRLGTTTSAAPSSRAMAGLSLGLLAQAAGEHAIAVTVLEEAVRLLPVITAKDADWGDSESRLGVHVGLAIEAVAAHCAIGDVVGAVETGELGRGILLAAQLESRTDLTVLDEQLPELAQPFRRLRELLNSTAGDRTGLWARHDQVLAQIRTRPGFERFLLPPLLDDLRPPNPGDTIVLVNAGWRRSDAILIGADHDPVHVALDGLKLSQVRRHSEALLRVVRSTGSRERLLLQEILGWLWDAVVSKVVKALDASPDKPRRVWWLPVGHLGLFPLHAAGHPGGPSALDSIVSSYTPTLRVLAHTQTRPPAAARRQLTVALARTPGLPDLVYTIGEAHELHRRNPGGTRLANQEATRGDVLAALPQATWTHFACHARADHAAPSTGGLCLYDGTLTIPEIVRLDLADAELAYLSACSTADRSPEHIEESINLASAFHLAGFRHVIASLWPLSDAVAVEAAKAFYQALPANPTASTAAIALHQVTRELRAKYSDYPELWAPLIHSGP